MQTPSIAHVLSDFTLYQAFSKVYENQGCAGVDYQTLDMFAQNLHSNLDTLRNEISYGTYKPLPLLRVQIEKPTGGKRALSIPAVRDRVLQTAVTQIIEPVFEAEFENCSFAYRKGRSVDQAIQRVQFLQRQGFQWVVDADIQNFFDNIDHSQLLAEIAKLVTDAAIVHLIKQWLRATVQDGDRQFVLHKGVPQGSPIAPLLSNLYLDQLDEVMFDNRLCLVRFADDFLILCKSRERAEHALELTDSVLNDLKLKLNANKTRIVHFDQGFRFLGVHFIRSLAFKTEADPVNMLGLPPVIEKTTTPPPKLTEVKTMMQQAFLEANVTSKAFVSTVKTPDSPDVLADDYLPSDYDPLLRTLYILQHGQVLAKESERLIVKQEQKIVREIPAIKVDQIMVFGNAQITTQAMQFCLQEKIPIYLLSGQGHYYGVIDSFSTEPVLLHREQFLRANDEGFCLKMAISLVHGKIANSRLMIKRQSRRHNSEVLQAAADTLKDSLTQLTTATDLDQLRGFEGNAAKVYFKALSASVDSSWNFNQRVRQPPTDGINAMLSYGYTLLFYNIYSLLLARGLNPHVGFLHSTRPGHPALASDLMEEFRAIVVDAVVWKLVVNNQLSVDDFTYPKTEDEPCILTSPARQLFIRAIEQKLNSAITHPVTGTQMDYRRCIEYQVLHLAQVIRGVDADYQPLILR